jgi:PAS domain S-box-containing protein
MGERICAFDWSSTPLGPIDSWPSSLREAVSLCLRSRFPGLPETDPRPMGWAGQEGRAGTGPKARVLVADDNADMRHDLCHALAGRYEVEVVGDGVAALAAARTRPPDLVLADVMMTALDGFGLLEALRADAGTATVPVVLLSDRAAEESRVEGLTAKPDDYLVKPFSTHELLARVGTHLEMARVRREAVRRESELLAEARRAREHAAAILESITHGYVALDSQWRFTCINAETERINGIPRQEQIGKNQWELFPATRGTRLEFELRRAVAEQAPVQFEYYYEAWDAWFQYKAYPTKDGGLSIFYHDITARKRLEEALRNAHEQMEQRVRARRQELSRANARLELQIAKRKEVEAARTDLLRRLVHAQEEEHRRIARELHDDLTQRLAALAIDAAALEQVAQLPRDIRQRLRDMRGQLVSLSQSVHCLSRQLHPAILDDLGLVDALRSECTSVQERDGIQVNYRAENVPTDLPRGVALCVYRVTQEALRNAGRHSQSLRVLVRLVANDQGLVLRIRDHGIGFDVAGHGRPGVGLESMRERARLVHARLMVHSRRGEGTQVTLRVPLQRSSP